MRVAFFDIFNPIPINSGGDWYRYHLLNETGRHHEVTGYYNVSKKFDKGFIPPAVNFQTEFLESAINWSKVSRNLEMLRPEFFVWSKPIRRIEADAIFFSTVCYHIAKKAAKCNDAPLILFMHNVEWQYLRDNKSLLSVPMRIVEDHIIKNADAVITLSEYDKKYAERIAKGEVFYCPPIVDENIFSKKGPSYNFGSDKFNVLFYGSLDRKQNIDAADFITNQLSCALCKSDLNDDVRLNIFGSGVPPEFLKTDPRINFLGAVDNPGYYVRGADAVIVPVRNTGGIKIRVLEALACGKPVIVARETAKGLPTELRNKVLVADDVNGFVEHIRSVMSEPPERFEAFHLLEGSTVEEVIEYARAKACV